MFISVCFGDLPPFQEAITFFKKMDKKNLDDKLAIIDNFFYQDLQSGNTIIDAAILGKSNDPENLLIIIKYLMDHGALHPNTENIEGKCAILRATSHNLPNLLEYFHERNSDWLDVHYKGKNLALLALGI